MNPLARGFLIGLAIAAPVGPIAVLCIRRTLVDGRLAGFVSGLGAATADAIYAAVAAFGLRAVSDALVRNALEIRLVGALFLLYLGARTLVTKTSPEASTPQPEASLPRAYLTTFMLTLANPMTILSFAAVFTGVGFAPSGPERDLPTLLVAGVLLGSSMWWLMLSMLAGVAHGRLQHQWLLIINRVAGVVIISFAVFMLAGGSL